MAESKPEPAVAKNVDTSDVDPLLDKKKMFEELWWLEYCCCYGTGVGAFRLAIGGEGRELCIHSKCQLTSLGDPFCSGVKVDCCFTSQCAFPKVEDGPTCVCCSKELAGKFGSNWKPKLFEWEMKGDGQFWLYYFLCGGVSAHAPYAGGRPLFGHDIKELCIKSGSQCVMPPCVDGVLCSGLSTHCCFFTQMEFPPKFSETPKIACCGWMLNKDLNNKGKPMSYGKPAMQEMK